MMLILLTSSRRLMAYGISSCAGNRLSCLHVRHAADSTATEALLLQRFDLLEQPAFLAGVGRGLRLLHQRLHL